MSQFRLLFIGFGLISLTGEIALAGRYSGNGTLSAKDRTEAECVTKIAKQLLDSIKWGESVQLENKIYWKYLSESQSVEYTVYANGTKELAKAQIKLQFRGSWSAPICIADSKKVNFLDHHNKEIGFQGNDRDQTPTEYFKYSYAPDEEPTRAFLAERGYEPAAVVPTVVDEATLKRHVNTGLATALVGAAGVAVRISPTSSLARKTLKRAAGPLLLADGALRIYDANRGVEPSTIAVLGPILRLDFSNADSRGVLRLAKSYEEQLDEKKK